MTNFCAAVDWGTSSFRLWLLDETGSILDQRQSPQGLLACPQGGFADILASHLDAIAAPPGLPVVICGMAGSRQGWLEAPYQNVPVPMSSIARGAVRVPGLARDVWILPGIAQHDPRLADVMRGEETQIFGAFGDSNAAVTACLPGTHSKWVALDNGAVQRFRTFMSGDLYAAISGHTILAQSGPSPEGDEAAFATAVRQALDTPDDLTAALFNLRGRQLLGYLDAAAVAPSISGLLIGCEIANARRTGLAEGEIMLIASGVLADRYAAAFDVAGLCYRSTEAETAVIAGLYRAARGLLAGQAREQPS